MVSGFLSWKKSKRASEVDVAQVGAPLGPADPVSLGQVILLRPAQRAACFSGKDQTKFGLGSLPFSQLPAIC